MNSGPRNEIGILVVVAALCTVANAARLDPKAQSAFDQYVATVEARLQRQHARPSSFLAGVSVGSPGDDQAIERLKSGIVLIESVLGQPQPLPGALLHHWRGTAFVQGASAAEMLALLRDYRDLPRNYAPEIQSVHVLTERPGEALIDVRMRKTQVVTVVLDGQFDVQTQVVGTNAGYSVSRSTHTWEVDAPNTSRERRMPEGDDDGFLWKLNSYWSFVEVRGGLVIQCEAVSLTRDIPAGLGWIASPVVEQLPRQSLAFTLDATQKALSAMAAKEKSR